MKSGKTNETLYKNPVKLGKTRKLDHKPYRGTKYQKDTHAQKKEQLNSTATDGSRFLCQRRKKERKTTEEENGKKQKKNPRKMAGQRERKTRSVPLRVCRVNHFRRVHSFVRSFIHSPTRANNKKKTSSKATCFFFSLLHLRKKNGNQTRARPIFRSATEKKFKLGKKKKLGKISLGTVNRTQWSTR